MIMAEKKDPSSSSSSSSMNVSDALLFTTMCMVGLPVEVQVKDGSLYSGIFHTASLDNGYGVILKKARKIGKGRHENSFTIGSLVDTLVVFSDDLVQIAVKDILFPVERFVDNLAGGGMEAAARKIESQDCMLDSERDPKPLASGNNSPMGINIVVLADQADQQAAESHHGWTWTRCMSASITDAAGVIILNVTKTIIATQVGKWHFRCKCTQLCLDFVLGCFHHSNPYSLQDAARSLAITPHDSFCRN